MDESIEMVKCRKGKGNGEDIFISAARIKGIFFSDIRAILFYLSSL